MDSQSEADKTNAEGSLETINARLQQEIAECRKAKTRLIKINECFLGFSSDPIENINRLTKLLGELLGATCAIYNRMQDGMLCSTGQWNTPADYKSVDEPEGHICFDVITQDKDEIWIVPNLPQTSYARTDPNVSAYQLQTYVGKRVQRKDEAVGSLCAVFQTDFELTPENKALLGVIASAVGVEEERLHADNEIKEYRDHLERLVEERTTELTKTNLQLREEIAERKQTEIALRASEQRYKVLLNSVTDYIYTVKVENNQPVATVHGPGCLTVTGYSQEEYKLDPYLWYRMIVDEDRDNAVDIIEQVISGEPVTPFEHRIKHKDGSIRWVKNTPVARYNKQGELIAYDSLVSDITDRKQAQESVKQRNLELELLNRAGQAFISTLDLDEVLATILNEVRSLLDVIGCSAWLVDYATNELVCKQVTDPQSTIMRGWRLAAGEGLAGWVAEHGESLNTPDVFQDDRHFRGVDQQTGLPIRSILTVPLIAKARIIGVFQVVDQVVDRFSATDLTLVESLAAATASAIEQARLYDNLRASQEYIRNIIDSSLDMIITVDEDRKIVEFNRAAQQCFGYQLHDVVGQHIEMLYADQREAFSVYKAALKNGQTVQEVQNKRKDGRVFPSILSASVLRDAFGELVGIMGISRDITFSKQAEVEREELLKLEQEQRLQLETLSEATLALTSQISHQTVLDEILNQAQRLVPYTTANISLLKDNILRPVRWHGYEAFNCEEAIENLVQRLEDFPIDAKVIESRQPQVIYDVQAVDDWVPMPETEWIRSSLLVPICHYQRVLGLLRLDNHNPGKYTLKDAERLQPMANVAAIALRNAQLYQNAVLTAETKLTLLNEVNHRVKNNLASIIGLLYTEMQNMQTHDQESYKRVMKNMINRVQGLANVHTILSASEWRPVRLSDLTQQIIHGALRTSASGKEVSVEIQPSPVKVSPEQASNLALVLNELATNTSKQAKNGISDTVHVIVRINVFNDTIRLEFRDNGAGYPEEMLKDIQRHNNTGFKLIHNIVTRNLRGRLALHNDHGAVTVLQFPQESA